MPHRGTTLVLGATNNPARYAFKAVVALQLRGFEVVPLGNKNGSVNGLPILKEAIPIENLDTITLYLNPERQKIYYDYIIALQPRRIIFNPGAENPELETLAESAGIACLQACTLVLLSIGAY